MIMHIEMFFNKHNVEYSFFRWNEYGWSSRQLGQVLRKDKLHEVPEVLSYVMHGCYGY